MSFQLQPTRERLTAAHHQFGHDLDDRARHVRTPTHDGAFRGALLHPAKACDPSSSSTSVFVAAPAQRSTPTGLADGLGRGGSPGVSRHFAPSSWVPRSGKAGFGTFFSLPICDSAVNYILLCFL